MVRNPGRRLAISEVFLSFAELSIEAGRRTVGLSLWRPDLPITDPGALGVQAQFLPRDLWVLGLGHLGNAYLWVLAVLPYETPARVEIYLNDFDTVERHEVIVITVNFGPEKAGVGGSTPSLATINSKGLGFSPTFSSPRLSPNTSLDRLREQLDLISEQKCQELTLSFSSLDSWSDCAYSCIVSDI
jgi:hypothetical protein